MAKQKAKSKKPSEKTLRAYAKNVDAQRALDAAAAKQTEPTAAKESGIEKSDVQKAIKEGLALLKDGKSKADAAWAIYEKLKSEEKELIVAAFVKGATLTEKGALTYWYNCRRRASKEAKKTS